MRESKTVPGAPSAPAHVEHEIKLNEITLMEEKLVGAPAIATFLQCSVRHVRRLSRRGVPIYKPPGDNRLTAFKSELMLWQRTKCPV